MRNRLRSALVLCSGAMAGATVLTTGNAFGQKAGSDLSRGSDPSREDKAEKAAFEGVCGTCHPSSMVDSLRSESEWRETVEVMVKAGAKGTDDQFDRLMRFLLRNWT